MIAAGLGVVIVSGLALVLASGGDERLAGEPVTIVAATPSPPGWVVKFAPLPTMPTPGALADVAGAEVLFVGTGQRDIATFRFANGRSVDVPTGGRVSGEWTLETVAENEAVVAHDRTRVRISLPLASPPAPPTPPPIAPPPRSSRTAPEPSAPAEP